jgi:hypothetical protein
MKNMTIGLNGTFVLSAHQILLDNKPADAFAAAQVGQTLAWHGEPTRIDGAQSVLVLGNEAAQSDLRRRVARIARRRFDLTIAADAATLGDDGLSSGFDGERSITISNGTDEFELVPIPSHNGSETLYICASGLPVPGVQYRITSIPGEVQSKRLSSDFGGDVICFTKGTRIRTENGPVLVENLSVGDAVQTKDNGYQEVMWIGTRRMSGARLHAIPDLRPVRLRRDAIGVDIPDEDLLVSPEHRILVSGDRARALFNQDEVLVTARDLVNDHTVFFDHAVREVTYVHLLFADHQVIWANGVESESYHPANTTLKTVDASQRESLLELFPNIKRDPYSYGPFARRNLDKSEAAILMGGN